MDDERERRNETAGRLVEVTWDTLDEDDEETSHDDDSDDDSGDGNGASFGLDDGPQ